MCFYVRVRSETPLSVVFTSALPAGTLLVTCISRLYLLAIKLILFSFVNENLKQHTLVLTSSMETFRKNTFSMTNVRPSLLFNRTEM